MSSIASAYVYPSVSGNAELERRVVAYLGSRNFLSFRRLVVSANQGVVTLSGRLGSYHERQVAIESARRVAGVIRIVDRIVVDPLPDQVRPVPRFARSLQSSVVLNDLDVELLDRLDLALATSGTSAWPV